MLVHGMSTPDNKGREELCVAGVHLESEGYPNTLFRLRDLRDSDIYELREFCFPMWPSALSERKGALGRMRAVLRAIVAHLYVFVKIAIYAPRKKVYVPYPSVFVLWMLSFMPRRYSPSAIIADVFISLYDTIVIDRGMLQVKSIAAKILKLVEERAYRTAKLLVVDTEQNAIYLSALFRLPKDKFVSIPLSTDERNFRPVPYRQNKGVHTVLFVGTMIPLHGVGTILQAIDLLAEHENLHFQFIGDGQDAGLVDAWLNRGPRANFTWQRDWMSSKQLAEAIANADICLGIFGEGDKTQRVCPLKMYAYFGVGRAVITGDTRWVRDSETKEGEGWISVPISDPVSLAGAIVELAANPSRCERLGDAAANFYSAQLNNSLALARLLDCFKRP